MCFHSQVFSWPRSWTLNQRTQASCVLRRSMRLGRGRTRPVLTRLILPPHRRQCTFRSGFGITRPNEQECLQDPPKEWERASQSASGGRTYGRAVSTNATFIRPAADRPPRRARRSRKPHFAEWTQLGPTFGQTWRTCSLCRRHQEPRRQPRRRKVLKPFPSPPNR